MDNLTEILVHAGNTMLLGMVIVFCFLTFLIACVNCMSFVISRYFPDAPVQPKSKPVISSKASTPAPATLAAVAAAVHAHRGKA
ncbi:OadG family protein [Echinimonas agarilytica]|uniref:Probable oxaloacetate decarboxylase gamma chain n=1 Tax=Echinimonas agarilytica TaxID=1215918 RepID=A0AA41W759_9GAMM|nr:OadG family protein [Echinimonas agarilytica]MCM2680427.1 OadG family protein [Echinimonas agarilytica]